MERRLIEPAQLNAWAAEAVTLAQTGQLPHYIPRLSSANPRRFALHLLTARQSHSVGDLSLTFPLMSVIKPFLLLRLLTLGTDIFAKVGMEPSEYPFNSLAQLQADGGRPRNPLINSGAIALAALLPGQDAASRCRHLCQWLNGFGCQLYLDSLMLASVRSVPNPNNQALAQELASAGYVQDAASALATYNQLCCLSGTIADLARLGMLLVQCPSPLYSAHCRTVKALMTTCGLYQASGRFAVEVGLPTKSGVSGAVLAVIPRSGAIACYSPPLDQAGNSIAGLFLLKKLALTLDLSIFT
ncbi:MAG: glutaminase [Cyanophyceae cyanobacterium]